MLRQKAAVTTDSNWLPSQEATGQTHQLQRPEWLRDTDASSKDLGSKRQVPSALSWSPSSPDLVLLRDLQQSGGPLNPLCGSWPGSLGEEGGGKIS